MEILLSLLPLVLLLLLLSWAVIAFRRKNGKEQPGPHGIAPYGVHGFLALFIFLAYYIAPLFTLGTTIQTIDQAERSNPGLQVLQNWDTYKALLWLLVCTSLIIQVLIAYRLRNHWKPSSLYLARGFAFLMPLALALCDAALAAAVLDVPPTAEAVGRYLASVVLGSIWGLYFLFSRRCRNTYLRGPVLSMQPATPDNPHASAAATASAGQAAAPHAADSNTPLDSTDLSKLLIFVLLMLPTLLAAGAGVIPAIFLVFGWVMARRNRDFSHVQASVRNVTWYLVLLACLAVAIGIYNYIADLEYSRSYAAGNLFGGGAGAAAFLTYIAFTRLLYLSPLKKHAAFVVAHGMFGKSTARAPAASPQAPAASAPVAAHVTVADELLKWVKLKEDGHISQEQFENAKARLLQQ